jgi:hypothetical protein
VVGFAQELVLDVPLIGFCPTKYGVYVKVKDEDEATGVTVRLFCAEFPPLVNVPRFPPSESVTVFIPSNVALNSVTVHVEDAASILPLDGQLENVNVGAPNRTAGKSHIE